MYFKTQPLFTALVMLLVSIFAPNYIVGAEKTFRAGAATSDITSP
jgi:hypothetical protein